MLKYIALLFIWYPLRSAIYFMPSCVIAFGSSLAARLALRLSARRATVMREELKALISGLPEDLCRETIEKAFKFLIMEEAERLFFDKEKKVLSLVEFKGLDNLDSALKDGKGAILSLMHFGNHLLVIPALGYKGYPIYQLAEQGVSGGSTRGEGFLQGILVRKRKKIAEAMPAGMIHANKMSKKVYTVLKENKVLLAAIDGRVAKNTKGFEFLGRQMLLSNGVFKLALSTGAPVLPLFMVRNEEGRNLLVIEERLEFKTPDEGVEKYLKIFERYFLKFPHHYAANMMFEHIRSKRGVDNPLFSDLAK